MENCIFCNIVSQKIPSYKVYEDADYLAFLDVFPRVKGHTLVIPKKHYRRVYDVPQMGQFFEVARNVALKVKKAQKSEFISFVTLGEAVAHAHIHILPQSSDTKYGGIRFEKSLEMLPGELASLARDIAAS